MVTEPQAVCAIHVANAATGTCTRCGNYVCFECTDYGRFEMCPDCRQRLGLGAFPFTREQWSVGGLWNHAWEKFLKHWPILILSTVAFFAISFGISFVFQLFVPLVEQDFSLFIALTGVSQVVQTIVNLALSLGLVAITIDVVLGREVTAARVVRAVLVVWKALVQYLIVLIAFYVPLAAVVALPLVLLDDHGVALMIVGGALLVLTVPIVYVALGLLFMQYEIVYDPAAGPVTAIRRSWQIARGQRWYVLGVSLLAGLIGLGGALLCCIGVLASYPLAMLILASLYLALRNGSGLPDPAV